MYRYMYCTSLHDLLYIPVIRASPPFDLMGILPAHENAPEKCELQESAEAVFQNPSGGDDLAVHAEAV